MLIFFLMGLAAGAASGFYLAYNYHPLLLNGAIHGATLVSGLIIIHFVKKFNVHTVSLYMAGALPVHLAIHFTIIGDLA